MPNWQVLLQGLSPPLAAEITGPAAAIIRVDGKHATRFAVTEVSALTSDAVDDVLARAAAGKRQLLVYDRSSPASRERLREAGWSYMGADGRVLLQAPPLYVDRDRPADRSTQQAGWGTATRTSIPRNPFAVRGSRVARWLLLHPEQSFVISELAAHVELSVAAGVACSASARRDGGGADGDRSRRCPRTRGATESADRPAQRVAGGLAAATGPAHNLGHRCRQRRERQQVGGVGRVRPPY